MGKLRFAALALSALAGVLLLDRSWPVMAADRAREAQPEYLRWPLPTADSKYGVIDGHSIWQYVVEQAKIAERYRDNGHPQYWGRIAGTSADTEDAHWLEGRFRQAGLTDTRIQTIAYLAPQWAARSWNVAATSGGKVLPLASAQPSYGSPATDGKELNLDLVYVGLGSEADFKGRDVQGKAVLLVKSSLSRQAGPPDILKRAEDHGAAAILSTDLRGANQIEQAYRTPTKVPTFLIGTKDAEAIRDLIAAAPASDPPHLKIRLDAEWVTNQHSYLVWGTLPGETDETIYVIAHRDGWFDAAGDNASGVASMIGLAEYFAKLPKNQRRRTMIFIGTDGHHNIKPGDFGIEWLAANRDKLFSKTALMINDEHPAELLSHGGAAGWTNDLVPLEWYAGGPERPELQKIALDAFHEFGVPIWAKPSASPPAGDLTRFNWFLPGLVAQSNDFIAMHTTEDTPENVPWTGLEAITRAYAKIIDQVNTLPLSALQRPAAADPNAPGSPQGEFSLANCAGWVRDSSQSCKL